MTKGRHTKHKKLDGKRCRYCNKVALDKINGEYLCRIHSPMRSGFVK